MRRYPPNTIYRCLDLPSTQIIRTHNSHLHNTTTSLQTLVQAPNQSPPTPNTPLNPKHRHTHNTSLVPTGLIKRKPNPIIHSPPTLPRAKHILISHTPPTLFIPRTTLIHSTSAALDTIHEPRVPLTYSSALTTTTHPPFLTPALPSPSHPHTLSAYRHATQTTRHASQSPQPPHPHRVPQQPHIHTKDDHMTTYTTQGDIPSSKRVSKDSRTYISESKQTGGAQTAYSRHTCRYHHNSVHNFTTVRYNKSHKTGAGLITLIR